MRREINVQTLSFTRDTNLSYSQTDSQVYHIKAWLPVLVAYLAMLVIPAHRHLHSVCNIQRMCRIHMPRLKSSCCIDILNLDNVSHVSSLLWIWFRADRVRFDWELTLHVEIY